MELNLPDNLYEDYSKLKLTSSSAASPSVPVIPVTPVVPPPSQNMMFQWIIDLQSPSFAISNLALQNLVNHRGSFEILPQLLWYSTGTVVTLLREVTTSYRQISLPVYSDQFMPIRIYNILIMFQCIALHPETRAHFLKAKMPHYFYPLMDIGYNDRHFECIRLGAMGVIAHLLKAPVDPAAIRFLMDTGAFGFCTKPIEIGNTESKTLAVFILHKILCTDEGLQYCCVLADRFFVIDGLLKKLLVHLSTRPSSSLFNLVVACYAKLSQKPRACDGLRRYTPSMLFDGTFANLLAEDPEAIKNHKELILNLEKRGMK